MKHRRHGWSLSGPAPSFPNLLSRGEKGGRRAYTLIEVLIAMAIVAALTASLGALVSQVIAANAASSEHLHDIATLGAIARQFRGDARAAVEVSADPAGNTLTLTGADGSTIEYKIEGSSVQRAGTSTKPSQPTRREVYALNTMRVVGWKRDGNEVALTIARGAHRASGTASNATFEIVSVTSDPLRPNLTP